MFDPGDGAYFTFVSDPHPNFLAGAPNGLDQNEADDADNILYGDTLPVDSAFARIAQTQGNSLATMKITAYDIDDAPQGAAFVGALGTGDLVTITAVRVFDQNGNLLEDSEVGGAQHPKVGIILNPDGTAAVSGLAAGYKVEWDTNALHDQVLIEGVAGKFDIGGFGVNRASTANVDIGGQLRFEDDGPSIVLSGTTHTLTVDETALGTDAQANFTDAFTPTFGADGQGATPVSFALSTPGGNSGLTDTATGEAVVLSLENGQVFGRTAVTGFTVFVVSVDAAGNVALDQQRAVVHANPNDPDESRGLSGSNLVLLTATAIDGDQDSAGAPLDLTRLLAFEDDGPGIVLSGETHTLTVDETALGTDAQANFTDAFTPTFGADGQGATPVSFALSTPGGNSGLTDTATGEAVVLSLENGQVFGRTAVTGFTVFAVSVDAAGNVALDQQRAVVHANPNDPDESRGLSGSNLVL